MTEHGRYVMLVARWLPIDEGGSGFATHLHGRDLSVLRDPPHHAWHWRVATTHGETLAEGDAVDRAAAEAAAEDEATAIHPPTTHLIDQLLS